MIYRQKLYLKPSNMSSIAHMLQDVSSEKSQDGAGAGAAAQHSQAQEQQQQTQPAQSSNAKTVEAREPVNGPSSSLKPTESSPSVPRTNSMDSLRGYSTASEEPKRIHTAEQPKKHQNKRSKVSRACDEVSVLLFVFRNCSLMALY